MSSLLTRSMNFLIWQWHLLRKQCFLEQPVALLGFDKYIFLWNLFIRQVFAVISHISGYKRFKGSLKKPIESVSMLIPPSDPPPFCERLRLFFLQRFLDYWGCVVRCETDFVPFLINFDQNNAKQRGRRTAKIWQFDKLKVRELILMVK